jgi:glycosyltransferase involved in cell wall biosynthesis
MIYLLYHNGMAITRGYEGLPIVEAIYKCAQSNPDDYLLVHEKTADIDTFKKAIPELHHQAYFFSNYNHTHEDLGYVEDGPFLNINKKVTYPTWLKGTAIVCIHAKLVNMTIATHSSVKNYLYWLNSIGRLSRPLGVLNYQIPTAIQNEEFKEKDLYRFVKQHYKTRWVFILFLCHLWYEKRFPIGSFVKAFFYKRKVLNLKAEDLQSVVKSKDSEEFKYDVIIPTMGRASYLKDVLLDLASQTILPQKIVIVEQNEEKNTKTQLDYLTTQSWPFPIAHNFIHQTGACNARNLAISKTTAPWVLFFDDDNRFDNDIMERVSIAIKATGSKILNLAYLQKGEVEKGTSFKQWESFGSGCSIVHRDIVERCKFDMALEHGYGEDVDYGMQIRQAGYDVIYAPQIQLLHLKAPVGGFRKPHFFPWKEDEVQPKPSPQIMYHRKKNYTHKQLLGYKLVQFFKTYGGFGTKLPWMHYKKYKQAWVQSEKRASEL